ncbi:ANKHD1 [Symbiodinium natans]|uniref:ANKHD1 protein n=1 Tax=Symbiodinium natans TaxID=878477 RepID=A0A812L2N9_9DINO|nr:ANKHD1 [Symbiodinium natans]
MIRVRSLSGEVLAAAPADDLRSVGAVKCHLRTLYSYPVCLQQLLEDERVLEDSALLDGSLDLQLVMLSDLGPEQMPMCAHELVEYAAQFGHVEVAQTAASWRQQEPPAQCWHDRPHARSEHGQVEIVRLLLEAGAEVNLADMISEDCSHVCICPGTRRDCTSLLEAGADMNLQTWTA